MSLLLSFVCALRSPCAAHETTRSADFARQLHRRSCCSSTAASSTSATFDSYLSCTFTERGIIVAQWSEHVFYRCETCQSLSGNVSIWINRPTWQWDLDTCVLLLLYCCIYIYIAYWYGRSSTHNGLIFDSTARGYEFPSVNVGYHRCKILISSIMQWLICWEFSDECRSVLWWPFNVYRYLVPGRVGLTVYLAMGVQSEICSSIDEFNTWEARSVNLDFVEIYTLIICYVIYVFWIY